MVVGCLKMFGKRDCDLLLVRVWRWIGEWRETRTMEIL